MPEPVHGEPNGASTLQVSVNPTPVTTGSFRIFRELGAGGVACMMASGRKDFFEQEKDFQ